MRLLRKILSYICLGCILWGGMSLGPRLPPDTGAYIAKKYDGWSGVLRAWIFSEWKASGNFNAWLNAAAAEFEKAHPGVYIEFEAVTAQAMQEDGMHPPDMKIFSYGTIDMDAAAIAMGGYVFVQNPSAAGTVIAPEHCGPLLAMYERQAIELPEPGLDLGLPAMNSIEAIETDENAFTRFMNGEVGWTIVDQAQLGRLDQLRQSGRGPDWQCDARGGYSWCDQRLMLGICADGERGKLCEAFLEHLLTEETQRGLASIGCFSPAGFAVHEDISPWREMEQQMLGTRRLIPKPEHSGAALEDYVRKLSAGEISAGQAAALLVQTCS